jgi:hypothetical protein
VTGALRAVYRYWILILLLGYLVQFFLAGYGAFDTVSAVDDGTASEDQVDDAFGPHAALGFFLILGGLLLFLFSLGARLGRDRVLLSLALPLWTIVQMILAWIGSETAVVGGLHPVNGLLIVGFTAFLAQRSWRRWTDLGAPVRA